MDNGNLSIIFDKRNLFTFNIEESNVIFEIEKIQALIISVSGGEDFGAIIDSGFGEMVDSLFSKEISGANRGCPRYSESLSVILGPRKTRQEPPGAASRKNGARRYDSPIS
ncbi:hypothetical protein [Methylomicrobium agile]|uniref:hypothetical protein n=1 Tax=Methylomicrobium agile TaxID=39774 RepID=UPI0012F69C8B|nr:hypothetical protein [Methylomicrobium agile]